jgi:mannose-6-phosphate isomerase
LLGQHSPLPRFPLLFKYLDASRDLSVQVHPNDAAAARLNPPDLGKTEAWLILDAQPGSRVYAGLKPGVDRALLEREMRGGRTEQCLHWFEPRIGDCLFIPAGTVHALGAGLLVAEIQQASDTTYRLFDWNRLGPDGRPRPLHIDQALAVVDYSAVAVAPTQPQPTEVPHVERLVACDKFVLDRWRIDRPQALKREDRFHIFSVLEGELRVTAAEASGTGARTLLCGQTLLVPAVVPDVTLAPRGNCTLLDMYLPAC